MHPLAASPELYAVEGARIAVRKSGTGDPLLLVHGWPLSGRTWRKVLPALAQHFTCYAVDLLGAGDTEWTDASDFSFRGQAAALRTLVDRIGLERYSILAHDTGATISRQLCLIDKPRVQKLAMINTEIPHHRPPWIRFFQKLSYLPLARPSFRMMLQSRAFLRSSMGFGGAFDNLDAIDGEFHTTFIQPLIDSPRRLEGQLRYLRGIDWRLVDEMARLHREIEIPVALLWGENDTTFPLARAREIEKQLPHCVGLVPIAHARLLPHEEQPDAVATEALRFLRGGG